ncbi:MAG: bifunctional DNA primase/polymerase [Micromonosporaceae bacterium]|nr:bifunctional DNA primase/polymerase [Micromonosporaceae bacterium]
MWCRASHTVLARSAARYASHGWDVVPGASFTGQRFECGQLGCPTVDCHPAIDSWEVNAAHDPGTVAAWWRDAPYTVLLATGRMFDVLEVPAALGRPVLERLPRGAIGGPVAVTPNHRWMFLVRPGCPLADRLAGRADVILHGRGSWVPAPPTRYPQGRVRWRLHPRLVGYRLADPLLVQSLVIAAMPLATRRPLAIERTTSPT